MATLSESLVVKISADTAGLKKGVKEAQDATTKAGKKMAEAQTPLIDRLDKVKAGFEKVKGVALFFGAALVGGAAVVLKYEDSLRKLESAASLAGKDVDKLTASVKAASADGFVRFGQAAQKAKEAVANGFGDATAAVETFKSSMKMEDLGFGPAGELEKAMTRAQQATGKTREEIEQLGAKAGVLSAGFAPALETFADMKPAFDQVGLSFESFIENVGALRAKGATIETAIGTVSSLVDTFRGNNEGAAAALGELGVQFGGTKLAGSNLATTLAMLTQKQSEFGGLVKASLGDSQQYADVLAGIGGGGSSFLQQIGAAKGVVTDFNASLGLGKSGLDALGQAMNSAFDRVGETASSVQGLADKIQVVIDKITAFAQAIANPFNIVYDVSFNLGAKARTLFDLISDSFNGGLEMMPGMGMNKGGEVQGFAGGGVVGGVGNTDTVPAMLTPGEFVIRKEVAEKIKPLLKMLNGTPSDALWQTQLTNTSIQGIPLLELLGIRRPLGRSQFGMVMPSVSGIGMANNPGKSIADTVAAIMHGLGSLQLNSGGEVPSTTNNHNVTVNIPGAQNVDARFVKNVLVPAIQRSMGYGHDRRGIQGA